MSLYYYIDKGMYLYHYIHTLYVFLYILLYRYIYFLYTLFRKCIINFFYPFYPCTFFFVFFFRPWTYLSAYYCNRPSRFDVITYWTKRGVIFHTHCSSIIMWAYRSTLYPHRCCTTHRPSIG